MSDAIVTLLGDHRPPPEIPADTRARQEAARNEAGANVEAAPDDPDALIWLGRRTAYLGRFHDALDIFSRGIARFPHDARFYRHRGHRLLTLRRFAEAQSDFERAARLIEGRPDEPEPDGTPNPRGVPTSTLQFNIWYHLALARYLQANFAGAAEASRACLAVSTNPDALVATSYWAAIISRRLDRAEEAAALLQPITPDMDIIENAPYHRLLQVFAGTLSVEDLAALPAGGNLPVLNDATLGYGIGAWHLVAGRQEQALDWFRRVYAGPQWAAFGFLAAEAELARLAGARNSSG